MKKEKVWKGLHYINIVAVIASIIIGLGAGKAFLIPIVCIYCICIELSLSIFKQSIITLILTIYLQMIGPVEMLLLQISPVNVLGLNYTYNYLFNDRSLYFQYTFLSVGMYLLILFFYNVFSLSNTRIITSKVLITVKSPISNEHKFLKYIILILFAFIQFQLRQPFSLDVPGKSPTIAGAGIIVYLYRFVGILLMYRCLCMDIHIGDLKIRNFLLLFIDYLLICTPDILLDRRGPLLYSLVVAISFIICVDRESFIGFVKKNTLFVFISVVFIAAAFSVFSARVRYRGVGTLSPLYIISRFTGVADGFIGLNYWKTNGGLTTFSLLDYFTNVLSMGGKSANSVYTHLVLGYPSSAIHTSSLPLFISSLMYDYFAGYVMISAIFGLVFATAKKLIDHAKNAVNDKSYRIRAFVGSYITVYATARVMGGGSERLIELFVLPIMLLVYSSIIGE